MLELEERRVVVHRVERAEDGAGPYAWGAYEDLPDSSQWIGLARMRDWRQGYEVDFFGLLRPYVMPSFGEPDHPGPEEDGIVRGSWGFGWLFGHSSIEQMIAWWGDALDLLPAYGFHVASFRVPARFVTFGRAQVIFDPDHAVRL